MRGLTEGSFRGFPLLPLNFLFPDYKTVPYSHLPNLPFKKLLCAAGAAVSGCWREGDSTLIGSCYAPNTHDLLVTKYSPSFPCSFCGKIMYRLITKSGMDMSNSFSPCVAALVLWPCLCFCVVLSLRCHSHPPSSSLPVCEGPHLVLPATQARWYKASGLGSCGV